MKVIVNEKDFAQMSSSEIVKLMSQNPSYAIHRHEINGIVTGSLIYDRNPQHMNTKTKRKPSALVAYAYEQGFTVLRPQVRYAGKFPDKKEFWVIARYNGFGWENWQGTMHYKSRQEAAESILVACSKNAEIINEEKLAENENF
jgi:hypothetical protein